MSARESLGGLARPAVTSIHNHETRQLRLIPSNKSCDGADNCGAIIGAGGEGEFFEVLQSLELYGRI